MIVIKLSKNKNIFDENLCTYQYALDKSNFKHKLTYKEGFNKQNKKRNRPRKIIFFKPQFCKLVKINLGKYYLN